MTGCQTPGTATTSAFKDVCIGWPDVTYSQKNDEVETVESAKAANAYKDGICK